MLILDDVMHLIVNNDNIALLFTQLVHHKNISCIIVYQNLFNAGKHAKTISLNAAYLVLFKNVRDKGQISYVGRQVFPGRSKVFIEAYNDAVSEPHSYLLIDMTAKTSDCYRLRSSIFPDDDDIDIYQI